MFSRRILLWDSMGNQSGCHDTCKTLYITCRRWECHSSSFYIDNNKKTLTFIVLSVSLFKSLVNTFPQYYFNSIRSEKDNYDNVKNIQKIKRISINCKKSKYWISPNTHSANWRWTRCSYIWWIDGWGLSGSGDGEDI